MAGFSVTGDQYRKIDRRVRDIQRQLDVEGGSPLDPHKVAMALQAIVEGKFDKAPKAFPTFHTVRIGVHKSFSAFWAAGEENDRQFCSHTRSLLSRMEWAQEERDLELVEVLDSDVGMLSGYAYDQFVAVVTSHYDLDLCPDEVGPAVRDQYTDQPMGERRDIAMVPRLLCGRRRTFYVERFERGFLLETGEPNFDGRFNLGKWWLFARRKRPASQG